MLINCFEEDIGTDQEIKLFEDSYVVKKMKRQIGKNKFEEFDAYGVEVWKNAWNEFDKHVFLNTE